MPEGLIYTHLDNGIHHFYWGDVKLNTVNEFVNLFITLYDNILANTVVRVMHDYRDTGTPSFNVIANAMKNFKVREDLTLRIAHLYSDALYPVIMQNASMVTRFDANRGFFKSGEEAEAIAWLLRE